MRQSQLAFHRIVSSKQITNAGSPVKPKGKHNINKVLSEMFSTFKLGNQQTRMKNQIPMQRTFDKVH